jgi:hypothetical protein
MRIARLVLSAAAALTLLLAVKPAVMKTDDGARLLILLRWQSGKITFVNSVTERPVAISFRIGSRFKEFYVITDDATDAYYTHGLYEINEAIKGDSMQSLRFCSMKGIAVVIGFYSVVVKDGCMEVSLLWTI